jgi:phage N-6-adenine-methyltransferase
MIEQPGKDEWSTPQWLYDRLDAEFSFTIDVAAVPWNAKHEYFYTPAQDALSRPWVGVAWMNPPYARAELKRWVEHAAEQARRHDTTVVGLIPAWTSTEYWHKYIMWRAHEIRLVHGRLRFEGRKTAGMRRSRSMSPPWGSAIIVWRGRPNLNHRWPQLSEIDAVADRPAQCTPIHTNAHGPEYSR